MRAPLPVESGPEFRARDFACFFREVKTLAPILEPIPHNNQHGNGVSEPCLVLNLRFRLTKAARPAQGARAAALEPSLWRRLGSHLMMVTSLMQNSYAPAALVLAGTWNWMPSIFAGLKATVLVPGGLMSAHMIVLTMFALTGDGL